MNRFARGVVIACMVGGALTIGCQRLPKVEYRAGMTAVAVQAPMDSQYTLWAYRPVRPPGTNPATRPVLLPGVPTEVDYRRNVVSVIRGERVGFQHKDGALVAFAGGETYELPEGHYRWTSAEYDERVRNVGDAAGRMLGAVLTGVAIAAVVAALVVVAVACDRNTNF